MNILIINYEFPPVGAGAATASWSLAKALTRAGHRVTVLTSAFGPHRGRSVEDGVVVYRVRAFRRRTDRTSPWEMLAFAVSAVLCVGRVARTEETTMVISFFTIPSGVVAWWHRWRDQIPYIISLRGGDVPGLVPELRWLHRCLRGLRRRVLKDAGAIVANSVALQQLSEAVDPFSVDVIPNGVDTETFCPDSSARRGGQTTRPFQFLFVGRLQPQKNLVVLLEQLARVRRQHGVEFELHIAGDGPLASAWRARARDLALEDQVSWHGWLDRKQLVALYQQSDCLVTPSRYEGLPNTVLEAMATGLPVIASRIAPHDLVKDGVTGLLFRLDEPNELGEHLLSLMADLPWSRTLGAAGRDVVSRGSSWDLVASQYLGLLVG